MIIPNWPVKSVKALSTTRQGGVSNAPYASFNLGLHVGDDEKNVTANRATLTDLLPRQAVWLNQIHSAEVVVVDKDFDCANVLDADALYTDVVNQPLAIMTADCLPVLLCSRAGDEVAAVHGGWRGLAAGIFANTIAQFKAKPNDIYVWLGPAIGPLQFEVGAEVKQRFCQQLQAHHTAFQLQANDKYLADIYLIAKQQLQQLAIENIFGGEYCTVTQSDLFFSYRRDGQTGRMASVIWRT